MVAKGSTAPGPGEPTFDEVIHAPMRLRICGLLRRVDALSFVVVRDALALTPATLSKHLRVLTESGYVSIDKTDRKSVV